jgi:REP element-mobilizing transposase RayT
MRRARWIIAPRLGLESVRPVIYHCISRVVNRELVFGAMEKERLRMFMRMYENFTGCRILSYCFMSNHIHLLLEITPRPAGGLSDAELLRRLRAIYSDGQVLEITLELDAARRKLAKGLADESYVARIHERYTYRMHDLSEFMKGFMQRYTQWHNRVRQRKGRLWEDRFKSVIVEDGVACKTMAAYIDLNPVRAGVVKDPAHYRWSSYGEAIGGGAKGNGRKAREGLVRALRGHRGKALNSKHEILNGREDGREDGREEATDQWKEVSREYRRILLAGAEERLVTGVGRGGETEVKRLRKGMSAEDVRKERERLAEREDERLEGIPFGRMLRCRVRYFTDGAVIGSRTFVNEAFASARERFGPRRKDGARKMRGAGAPGEGVIWSMRDLHKGV